jgi:hypothetical protein
MESEMAKLRIKRADIEIEIEGEDQEEIKQSLQQVLAINERHPPSGVQLVPSSPRGGDGAGAAAPPTAREGTINTAISRLGGDTCQEVLKAAAAHLTLFRGQDRFTDEDWEITAKAANSWKNKWSTEKAKSKKRLVASGFIIENAAGIYSISPLARSELEAKLAQ